MAPSQLLEMPMLTLSPAPMLTFSEIVPKEVWVKRKRSEEHELTTVIDWVFTRARRDAKKTVDVFIV